MEFSWVVIAVGIAILVGQLLYLATTMSVSTSWNIQEATEGAGIAGTATYNFTGTAVLSATVNIAAPATDFEFDLAFTIAKIQVLMFITNTPVVMHTNAASTGSPADTVNLAATAPWQWFIGSGITCPLVGTAGAVNKLFFTNPSSIVAAVVKIRGLQAL